MKLTTAASALLALLAFGGSAIAQVVSTDEGAATTPPKANLKVQCETDSYDCPGTFFSVLRDPTNDCEFYPCDFDTAATDAGAEGMMENANANAAMPNGGAMEAGEEVMDEPATEPAAETSMESDVEADAAGMDAGTAMVTDESTAEMAATETIAVMDEGADDAEALAVEDTSTADLPAEEAAAETTAEGEPATAETIAITAQPEPEAEAESTEEDTTEPVAEPPAEETTGVPAVPTTDEAAAIEEPATPVTTTTTPVASYCRACTNTPTKNMIKRSYDCTTAIQALAVQCRDDAGWRAGTICELSCYKAGRGYAHTDVSLEGGRRCCEEGEEPLTPEVVTAEEVQSGITPGVGAIGAPALGEVGDAAEVAREQDDEPAAEDVPATTATASDIAESAESMTVLEEATMAEEALIGDAPEDTMTEAEAGDANTETTEATSDEPTIEVNDEMVVDVEPASEATDASATTEDAEVEATGEPTTFEEDTATVGETTTPTEIPEAATTTEATEATEATAETSEATTTPIVMTAEVTEAENTFDGTTGPMCGPAAVGDVVLCPFAADGSMVNCCSSYGFCGQTAAYCGDGCQPGFGRCDDVPAATEIAESADEATAEPTTETTDGDMDDVTTTTTTAPEVGDLMPDLTEIAREDDAADNEESNGLRGSTAASAIQYGDSSAAGVRVTTGVVTILGAASAVLLGML